MSATIIIKPKTCSGSTLMEQALRQRSNYSSTQNFRSGVRDGGGLGKARTKQPGGFLFLSMDDET
jgi:hypothetical protein